MKYTNWNKEIYSNFINELYCLQDIKYKEFTNSLIPNNEYELIGIRIPILKKIAKDISKGDYISFINLNNHNTYEETMIHGLLIGYINDNINNIINLIKDYIPCINNWGLCDSFVANLHIIRKYTNDGLKLVKWCLNSKKTYYKRVGYIILLNYYIKEEYLDLIFKYCDDNKIDEYYVNMAIAWLISICFIKYPKETLEYIKNNKLNKWTHNKAIQKIRESKQVTKDIKDMLLEWKK